jgi:ABC-type dipeptide/oligopeptide/nickel transport system ATPase component
MADNASSPPLLIVEGLSVSYLGASGPQTALRDVSIAVGAGERVAIVGESGSGKSTLALSIAGFLSGPEVERSARRMEFDFAPIGAAPSGRLPETPKGISMVFQDAMTSLDPVWTVKSQLLAALRANSGLDKRAALGQAEHWLARVGLPATDRVLRARPYELSGGMRQRVMLAIALCSRPKLLIADEPTSALDALLSDQIMNLMTEMTRMLGTALLIVTHDIVLSSRFSDRTIVMRAGRVVETLRSAHLEASATDPYTIGLVNCVPTLNAANLEWLPTLRERAPAASSGK